MQRVQELNNSITYIADENKIIQYNLFTKQKRIIHNAATRISKYRITSYGKFIICKPNMLDNKKLYFNTIILDKFSWATKVSFLQMDNQIYVCVFDYYSFVMYDQNGLVPHKYCIDQGISMRLSHNGIYALTSSRRYDAHFISTVKSIYDIGNECSLYHNCLGYYKWVRNSDLLVHKNHMYNYDNIYDTEYHIYNIKTNKRCDIPNKCQVIDAIDYLIIQCETSIIIYDIHTMVSLKQTKHPDKFIIFHKHLALLVTENFDCYKITPTYELQKVNIGINYINDIIYTTSQTVMTIMEILQSNELYDLPDEIIYCELYKQMLNIFDAE